MVELTERQFSYSDIKILLGNSTENIKAGVTQEMLDALQDYSDARTWLHGDIVIGCGGVILYEGNKCEAWSIINKEYAMKFKRELLVGAKRFLDKMAIKHGIKYMLATWQVDFDPKIKWLEHLGFTKEDKMVSYNKDVSYVYSRSF